MRRAGNAKGFALIDLIFVVGVIAVLAIIATPRLLTARQTAGAASAIGAMRAISSAQLTFALTCGGGFYAPSLRVLGRKPPSATEAFISPVLGSADRVTRSGYVIEVAATPYAAAPASCNGVAAGEAGQAYKAGADLLTPTPEAGRYFATNANGRIFENWTSLFDDMPEVGEPEVGILLR